MKPIPLFGAGIASYSEVVTRQRRLNCFYDMRIDEDVSKIIVRGTPGTLLQITLPTYPIRGWHEAKGMLYVVAGAIVYKVAPDLTYTSLGAIPVGTNKVGIADNGLQLIIVDGIGGYIVTFLTLVLSVIGDGNFPNGATTVAFINGRFLANLPNSRQAYVGESYDGTNWTPAIFFVKENKSDVLVGVEVYNGTVILWGDTSMEFWQDVGASPVPYTRINGATQTWGLAALNSRAQLSNTEIFLAKGPQGGLQIMRLNGYTPERISTSDIENIIKNFSTFSDATAFTYSIDGHPMYQITFPTGNRSFLYDELTGFWYEVQTGLGLLTRHYADMGVAFNANNYVSDYSSGNIYQLRDDVYTDNGSSIKRQVCTRHVRANGNELTVWELYLDMETGVGLQSGQGQTPQIMLQVSRDNGRTFGNQRTLPLGKVGDYSRRVIARRFGSARDFVFSITMTDPVPFIITEGAVSITSKEAAVG